MENDLDNIGEVRCLLTVVLARTPGVDGPGPVDARERSHTRLKRLQLFWAFRRFCALWCGHLVIQPWYVTESYGLCP